MPRLRSAVLITVAVTAVLGAPAAPAGAKGIAKLAVCGPAGCVDRTRAAIGGGGDPHLLMDAGTPVSDESVVAEPFVRLRIGVGDGTSRKVYGRFTVVFLPRSGHMRSEDGSWSIVTPEGRAALQRLAIGVPRFPAARLGLAPAPAPAPARIRATSSDDGTPWGLIGGAAVALAAAAAAAFAVRRRLEDGRSPV